VVQTAESLGAGSKRFVCFVNSFEILHVTNNLMFYSFCSILSFIHFVHVSLSKKKGHIEEKVPCMVQIMVLETGYCLSAFVFLSPTLVYINQPKEFFTVRGCFPKLMIAQLM